MSDNVKHHRILPEGGSPPHNNKIESNGKPPHLCSVCGDMVHGYHYGAYTCKSCKSFFARMMRYQEDELTQASTHNDQCKKNISVVNRADCQHCRFERCKAAGMHKEVSNGKPGPLCKVCGDKAIGNYNGADACNACNSFFWRMMNNKETPPCKNNDQCRMSLSVENRKDCQHCRFEKCKAVGMKQKASRSRQPSSAEKERRLQQQQTVLAQKLTPPLVSLQSSAVAHSKSTSQSNSPYKSFSCGDSGSESGSCRPGQHLPNVGDKNNTLVPKNDTPLASPRMDNSSDEDLHASIQWRSSTQQQETEAEQPLLDLSIKKQC